jgi:hypothetical protein
MNTQTQDKLTIEDFKSAIYSTINSHIELFEVAKIMRPTMRGNVFLHEKDIKFRPLQKDSFEMRTFERLRDHSTPRIQETKIGKLLVWDIYALRIK